MVSVRHADDRCPLGLPAAAPEALPTRAVAAVRTGIKQTEEAQVFGLTRQTVNKWVQAW